MPLVTILTDINEQKRQIMRKDTVLRGMTAVMPLCIGDFHFSFIVGALSVSMGISVWQSTASSLPGQLKCWP